VKRALPALLCASLFGATTRTWELSGYDDFIKGRLEGLSITADGRLAPAPQVSTLYTSDQPEIWSIARAPNGNVYLGTGDQGRLYQLDPQGRATLLWTAAEPEIFAVAAPSNTVIYAGTSPNGKVYRIENGQATEYFAPGENYIWALAVAQNGDLFVATGGRGRIYRVTGAGRGEVYYDTGQSHVTALAFDAQRRLLAGTEPNGILYRITGPQRAFVLYDANLSEIRAIAPAPDGSIYAAALGGGVQRQATAAYNAATAQRTPVITSAPTSITVTEQAGIVPAPQPQAATPPPAPAAAPATAAYDLLTEKSALYRIHPDNTVETVWTSNQEYVYDAVFDNGSLLFLTDAQGRVYRLDGARRPALILQANQGDATRLLATPSGTLAATGHLGKILRIGTAPGGAGTFESPVHDAGAVARWGRLTWRGGPRGLAFRTRSGNTSRPDATWSEWSEPITNPDRAAITSPNARFIQWKAEFSSREAALEHVSIAYLPQNTPPSVRSVSVSSQAAPAAQTAPAGATGAAFSITVSASGETSTPAGTPAQVVSRPGGQNLQISWQADDPDGDRLSYTIAFRGEGEAQWKALRRDMAETSYTMDGDMLADGRYFFRVTASDRPSNPIEYAREAELVSAPVLIDNTPPAVTVREGRRNGSRYEAVVEAEDRTSPLRRLEYSVDAGPWTPVEAADGVTDSLRERFELRLEAFPAGEHLIAIRVFDAAGNAGLARIVTQ
jgi:hypothetical protein